MSETTGKFGEPWYRHGGCRGESTANSTTLYDANGKFVAAVDSNKHARRAEDCVNALHGMNPDEVAEVVEAVDNLTSEIDMIAVDNDLYKQYPTFNAAMDETLAALKRLKGE